MGFFSFFPSQRLNACKARNPLFETSKDFFSCLEMCIIHIPKNLMLGHNLLNRKISSHNRRESWPQMATTMFASRFIELKNMTKPIQNKNGLVHKFFRYILLQTFHFQTSNISCLAQVPPNHQHEHHETRVSEPRRKPSLFGPIVEGCLHFWVGRTDAKGNKWMVYLPIWIATKMNGVFVMVTCVHQKLNRTLPTEP